MDEKCVHGYDRATSYCPHCDNRARVAPLERLIATLRAELAEVKAQRGRRDEQAFEAGWHACADWANRDDLHSDTDSEVYRLDRDIALAAIGEKT